MSLFEKAGKKFEETRRDLLGGDEAAYVCRSCGEGVAEDYEYCPHCGEDAVEPRE